MERIWIYQADRQMSAEDKRKVLDKLELFTAEWKAHGRPLAAKAEIRYDRFIILMVDDAIAPPTGCSIDKSVYLLKEIEKETGLNLFDRLQMAYRDGDRIAVAPRSEFERLIGAGEVTGDTIVFNNLITTYPELETHWEVPLSESWHAQVFFVDS